MSDTQDTTAADRRCTNCGKPVDEEVYELWMFSTCRSCFAEPAPRRWSDLGTYRKWRYFPRWHMTKHPELPEAKRARYEAISP